MTWIDLLLNCVVYYIPLVVLGLFVMILLILAERYISFIKLCSKYKHIPGYEQFFPPILAAKFPKWLIPKDYFMNNFDFITTDAILHNTKKFNSDKYKVIVGILNIPWVVVANPEMGKEIATKGAKLYKKNSKGKQSFLELFFGSNIFAEDDQQVWAHHRHLIDPSFAPESLRMVSKVTSSTMLEEMIPNLDKQLKNRDVMTDFANLTMDVIGKAGFGYSFDSFHNQDNENSLCVKTTNFLRYVPALRLLPTEYLRRNVKVGVFGKLHESVDSFRMIIKDIIAKREREENNGNDEQNDVLSLLLKDRQRNAQDGFLTDDELISESFVLLVAGHETTARTLGFALYLLSKNPQAQKELQDGLDLFMKTYKKETFDYEDFTSGRLDFVKAVFRETLRLYPVAIGIIREVTKNVVWQNSIIPKQTFCVYTWYHSQVDGTYWDKAEDFIPSRFLKKDETSEQWIVFNPQTNPFIYTPFGIGGRICIGKNFAEVEAVLALAYLARRYQFKLTNPNYEMKVEMTITLKPREELLIDFIPRH